MDLVENVHVAHNNRDSPSVIQFRALNCGPREGIGTAEGALGHGTLASPVQPSLDRGWGVALPSGSCLPFPAISAA